jgi:PKD repeat protein
MDNNGIYDYSSPLPTWNYTYLRDGNFTIKLRVTDDLGATAAATTMAVVADTRPTADFTASPTYGRAPLTVYFTNNSTGYDQPLFYEWDFDGNGWPDSYEQNPIFDFDNEGLYTVRLTVMDSDGSTDIKADYITVEDVYTVSPDFHYYGQTCVRETGSRTFVVSNNVADDLVIDPLYITGADAAEFSIENDNCSGKLVVQSGNCTFDVKFLPASAASKIATVNIPFSSPVTEIFQVSVGGGGVPCPDIAASKVIFSEDFSSGIPAGWAVNGQWSVADPCSREINSPFAEPWAIVDCMSTGGDELISAPFDAGLCSSLELRFSNQFNSDTDNAVVQASGDSGATWTDALFMAADDGYPTPNTKKVDISAVKGVQDARIKFNYLSGAAGDYWAVDNTLVICQPAQLEYSSPVQATSSPQTIVVDNKGTADLLTGTLSITGADNTEFGIYSENCFDRTIAPSESCTVDIEFLPVSEGMKYADLSIMSNDPDTPDLTVSLSGTGTLSDSDGDGYNMATDCDDTDPTINPGASETKHDGIDQDCNGYDLTIEITKAGYSAAKDDLSVEANSDLGSYANLELVGYAPMDWNRKKQVWKISVEDAGGDPGMVTVCGIEGCESATTNGGSSIGTEGKGKTCSDGMDNDEDGQTDCDDSDCSRNKSCK